MSSVFIKVCFDDGTTFEAEERLIGDYNPIYKTKCLKDAMDKAYDDVIDRSIRLYGSVRK